MGIIYMKKFIISIGVFTIICSCCTTKTANPNTITWEEACELSWAYYLEKNNYPDLPWEEQPDSIQNDYLDCWAGSAQEDSLLMNYNIEY
jgi:hypothetical protein